MDRFVASRASMDRYLHAEGPISDAGCALWVDIALGNVHHGTVNAEHVRVPRRTGVPGWGITDARLLCHVDGTVGAALLAGSSDSIDGDSAPGFRPALVLAAGTQFIFVDSRGNQHPGPILPSVDGELIRFNDAKVDPWGRILAGTMAFDGTANAGGLYRLDHDGTVTTLLAQASISNGMAWSADGTLMYYIDSASGGIDVFDYGSRGTPSNRRRFVDIPSKIGAPDGMCIDEFDQVWVAIWGGSALRCYAPDGELVATVAVDAPQVSSCAFVGENLEFLLITTSQQGLSEDELRNNPSSGSLFLADVGVRGQTQTRFSLELS